MPASVRRFRLLAAFAIILLTGLYAPPGRAEVTITYSDWQLAQTLVSFFSSSAALGGERSTPAGNGGQADCGRYAVTCHR